VSTPPDSNEPAQLSPALGRVLLALAVAGLTGCLLFAALWWRASRAGAGLESLSPRERQDLLSEALEVSPGIYRPAFFAPDLGYTLVPDREIEAWGTRVAANDLGYRSPPSEKPAGTTRVLFLGDSWTFGMGVEAEEAFPARLAEMEGGVQSWSLALPGYNLLNQLAGLAFFGDRLAPDAVVVCPTPNDADSTAAVLPNGSLGRVGLTPADFGEPMHLVFRSAFADSHTLRERWRESFRRLRAVERRLESRPGGGVPMLVFFTGTWEPAIAHELIAGAGIESPYVITPPGLSVGSWRNPPPVRHPTPEAHALYARMIHRGLAPAMGWGETPPLPEGAPASAEAPVHRSGGAAGDEAEAVRSRRSAEYPERFRPGGDAGRQAVGPIDPATGLVGGGTMIQLRRPEGADRLRVTLGRVESAPSLYPLEVRLEVPSPSAGTEASVTIPAAGGPAVGEVALPADVPPDSLVDLFLRSDRTAALPGSLAAGSFVVLAVEPE
jgi:hypothetical protein